MARVVVVGGGLGGMAAGCRLAKQGHAVTLLEASPRLGGAVSTVARDGFRWDAGPQLTTLPAVLRDLFRKSGRPLEREDTDLVPVTSPVRHVFQDGTVLELPTGRGAQLSAVADALGPRARAEWDAWTAGGAEVWEALRRDHLERQWSPGTASPRTLTLLRSRQTLHRAARKAFSDRRLRALAVTDAVVAGQDPRNVPAWCAMTAYVEQTFGRWTFPGGMADLTRLLTTRLATRGVEVRTGVRATDLVTGPAGVTGVETGSGPVAADRVVVAIDPRRLPAVAPHVDRTTPAMPPSVTHVGLAGPVPDLPHEVVLHGDPLLVVRTLGLAPPGGHAWTLLGRGRLAEDLVGLAGRQGLRIRDQVRTRVDRSPRDQVEEWSGSPYGVLWEGRATLDRRAGTVGAVAGVVHAGAHTTPGAGVPYVGLSAALADEAIGPARRQ